MKQNENDNVSKKQFVIKKIANPNTNASNDILPTKKDSNCDVSGTKVAVIYTENIFKQNPQFKWFAKKVDAIEYIKDTNDLFLFSEDTSATFGTKRFYIASQQAIFKLSVSKKFHLYENYEAADPVKLFIDLDIKAANIPPDCDRKTFFTGKIDTTIDLVTKELAKYNIINPQIIILSSSREEKLSAHIIFKDVVFSDIYTMKYFMSNISSPLIDNKMIDMNVYRPGCVRLLWNSKLGKSNNLEYYQSINHIRGTDEELFMDCLLRNTTNIPTVNCAIPTVTKIAKKTNNPAKKIIIVDGHKQKYIGTATVSLLKKYVLILDKSRADDYNSWLDIGMCLFNCNSSSISFNLWDAFSKQSAGYGGRNICASKWNTFKSGSLSIATLKYYAKIDNPDEYAKIECSQDKPNYETIKINKEYLLDKDETIKSCKSFFTREINKWLVIDELKSFAINSTYNTGKTTLIDKILTEYMPKRVLFVSYRQSLTNDLYGAFKKHKFASYMDGDFGADRIICQIESLEKLWKNNGSLEYDLVILDEIESILAHFRSSTIEHKEDTFDYFINVIHNSTKILFLDGDFHNRAYELIKETGKHIIVENTCKKNKKHFIFRKNKQVFDDLIDDDLKNGKNIAIVSMSSAQAMFYYEKYKDKYKAVVHCSKSDDYLKSRLKNVIQFWSQYQLVCYSPTIEAGVNFDADHFDKIYVVLSSLSTTPRALMQMCCRIRKLKDSTVNVFLNSMPFREQAPFWTHDEIEDYIVDEYKRYLKPKTVYDKETKKYVLKYGLDLYARILVYNETEIANKEPYYFVANLIHLLTSKGHTYECAGDEQAKKVKGGNAGKNIMKSELVEAETIGATKYNSLLKKQKDNVANRDEKVMIEKYMYGLNWKVDLVDEAFLNKYYGKTNILFNLRYLLDSSMIDKLLVADKPVETNRIDKYLIPAVVEADDKSDDKADDKAVKVSNIGFDKAKILDQVKIIRQFITKLGFENVNDKKELSVKAFQEGMAKVIADSRLFNDVDNSYPLFGINKNKKIGDSIKAFMGFANSVFKNFGFRISTVKKIVHMTILGENLAKPKKTTKCITAYKLDFINNIIGHI